VFLCSNLAANDFTDVPGVLGSLWNSTKLRILNVSYNAKLELNGNWGTFKLDVLDISGTRIPVIPELCTVNISVFASEAGRLGSEYNNLTQALRQCSQNAKLLDVSAANAGLIQEALQGNYEELSYLADASRLGLQFRIQTTKSPVQCNLRQGVRISLEESSSAVVLEQERLVLEYQCRCSSRLLAGRRRCVPQAVDCRPHRWTSGGRRSPDVPCDHCDLSPSPTPSALVGL